MFKRIVTLPIAFVSLIALNSTVAAAAEPPVPDVWPTAVPEQPAEPAVCGNALLERGESCSNCPKDCEPRKCKPAGRHSFQVRVLPPLGAELIAATLHLAYRTDRLSIPGSGQEKSVLSRVDFGSDPGITAANDQNYSLRMVRSEGKGLRNPYATITFDGCKGSAAPTADDLVCVVEGCAGVGGVVEGCTCVTVLVPQG